MTKPDSSRCGLQSEGRSPETALRGRPARFMLGLMLSLSFVGCSLTSETTKSGRAPIEQLLLTQSLARGLIDAVLPVRPGQSVVVEAVGLTGDQAFAGAMIEKWLVREGLSLPKDGKESLLARVTLDAFGTLQDQTFFGIPPIGGGLFPISTPELSFYKASRQRGLARFSVDFIEKKTGRLVSSTPVYEGDAYYNQYTFLLSFNITRTDLLPPLP
ncbi:MAG: hypothetical protein ACREIS_08510 [Nitrospiraceae bacterium]